MTTAAGHIYDVAVIGGGINGVGIAADAAGRGLSVFLCEGDDLASHTSSASSKLIHGGLRYLEHREFRLVREALAEREVLLAKAPHIVKPMRFVLPHQPQLRPAWMIRAGLFLYDHLGKRRRLAASRGLRFNASGPLKPEFKRGFEYSDCWVDDARLVVLNAVAAREHGAKVATRTRCVQARREQGMWTLDMKDASGSYQVRARALVNATGPWVASFLRTSVQQRPPYGIRLVQGSHVVVPRLYEGDQAFIMQSDDRRIVFAIPYQDRYTMIGTTDREYKGDPASVRISDTEIDYVLGVANAHFRSQLVRADVVHTFSGVRPLRDDESDNPSAITRDYTLALSEEDGAPLLSVFGGKLTTYRKLAESAMTRLAPFFPHMGRAWTSEAPLPGGEDMTTVDALASALREQVAGLPAELAQRWATTYGSRVWQLLGEAKSVDQLGVRVGPQLYASEVNYLQATEWARTADDVLWRRTKLGLLFSAEDKAALEAFLSAANLR